MAKRSSPKRRKRRKRQRGNLTTSPTPHPADDETFEWLPPKMITVARARRAEAERLLHMRRPDKDPVEVLSEGIDEITEVLSAHASRSGLRGHLAFSEGIRTLIGSDETPLAVRTYESQKTFRAASVTALIPSALARSLTRASSILHAGEEISNRQVAEHQVESDRIILIYSFVAQQPPRFHELIDLLTRQEAEREGRDARAQQAVERWKEIQGRPRTTWDGDEVHAGAQDSDIKDGDEYVRLSEEDLRVLLRIGDDFERPLRGSQPVGGVHQDLQDLPQVELRMKFLEAIRHEREQ